MGTAEAVLSACERIADMLQRSLSVARSRYKGDNAPRAALDPQIQLIRYALATLVQRIQPALAPAWADDPPHVVTFGATNTGKSTVLNLLLGRAGAAMSELARYSQHPVAFCTSGANGQILAPFPSRFAGYQRYKQQHPPRQSDADLKTSGYRPALGVYDLTDMMDAGRVFASPASREAVFWDVPDYSTEEALFYMDAVLDTIALADLVVMVVTSESYANAIDQRMRGMIAASGVPILVVANKLLPGSNLLEDITLRLGDSDDPAQRVPPGRIVALPIAGSAGGSQDVLDQMGSTPEATALRRSVSDVVAQPRRLKRQALVGTVAFIERRFNDLVAPLQEEADVARRWVEEVDHATRHEFYDRYKKDYLDGQKYSDFNLSFLKALDYLEVPGVGKVLANAARFFRGVTGHIWNVVKSPFSDDKHGEELPEEQKVLGNCYEQWLLHLQRFAQVQNEETDHPEWARLARLMGEANFQNELALKLGPAWKAHRERMHVLIDERAQSMFSQIEEKPVLRNTLRTVKFSADTVAVGGAVLAGGPDLTDIVIGPGVAILLRLVYEKGGEHLAESQKRKLKEEQFDAFKDVIEEHMVAAVRELFRPSVRQEELDGVKADVKRVREAAMAIGGA